MELLTKEIRGKLPSLESTDNLTAEQQRVYLKLFMPSSGATWYATSFDGDDTFFGYVAGIVPGCDELGSFSLKELQELKGPFGLNVERDKYWDDKTTLAQVMAGEKQ
jgi:hypothetical protein